MQRLHSKLIHLSSRDENAWSDEKDNPTNNMRFPLKYQDFNGERLHSLQLDNISITPQVHRTIEDSNNTLFLSEGIRVEGSIELVHHTSLETIAIGFPQALLPITSVTVNGEFLVIALEHGFTSATFSLLQQLNLITLHSPYMTLVDAVVIDPSSLQIANWDQTAVFDGNLGYLSTDQFPSRRTFVDYFNLAVNSYSINLKYLNGYFSMRNSSQFYSLVAPVLLRKLGLPSPVIAAQSVQGEVPMIGLQSIEIPNGHYPSVTSVYTAIQQSLNQFSHEVAEIGVRNDLTNVWSPLGIRGGNYSSATWLQYVNTLLAPENIQIVIVGTYVKIHHTTGIPFTISLSQTLAQFLGFADMAITLSGDQAYSGSRTSPLATIPDPPRLSYTLSVATQGLSFQFQSPENHGEISILQENNRLKITSLSAMYVKVDEIITLSSDTMANAKCIVSDVISHTEIWCIFDHLHQPDLIDWSGYSELSQNLTPSVTLFLNYPRSIPSTILGFKAAYEYQNTNIIMTDGVPHLPVVDNILVNIASSSITSVAMHNQRNVNTLCSYSSRHNRIIGANQMTLAGHLLGSRIFFTLPDHELLNLHGHHWDVTLRLYYIASSEQKKAMGSLIM